MFTQLGHQGTIYKAITNRGRSGKGRVDGKERVRRERKREAEKIEDRKKGRKKEEREKKQNKRKTEQKENRKE